MRRMHRQQLLQMLRIRAQRRAVALVHDGAAIEHHDWPEQAVTVSVGVATVRTAAGDVAGDLVRDADRALYRSKSRGRNVVTHAQQDGVAAAPS